MSQHGTLTSTVDAIMEQAQVFASAWSLVGGMFDKGDMLEEANVAKAELRDMVSAALSATQPAQAAQSVQGVPERAEMALRMLEDPTPEMLESFQRGFMQQLKRRKHYKKGWEISAEQAGIKAMLETVLASVDAASPTPPAQQAAQGAGEVVAIHPSWLDYWSFKECDRLARIWTEGIDLTKSDDHEDDIGPQWKVVMAIMLARLTHPTQAQPAPVVPDGWKLVPMKCDEAMKDVGIQFEFATVSDGRLLAQTMWNELLAATPTPPAQAAADARDAFERVKLAGAQLANIAFNLKQRVGHTVSTHDAERMEACQKEWDAALATHQQGGSDGV